MPYISPDSTLNGFNKTPKILASGDPTFASVFKFGYNPDIDTATAPEDIRFSGGDYPFLSSPASFNVISTSANDTAAGTGARTIEVQGLDANYFELNEQVTLNGLTQVSLVNQFIRINRAFVVSSGTGLSNAGDVSIRQGTIVFNTIPASLGQTQSSIYTVPANYKAAYLAQYSIGMQGPASAAAQVALMTRFQGGPWRTTQLQYVSGASAFLTFSYEIWPRIAPRADIKARCLSVTNNNTVISYFYTLILER
jgi:hypothetical protein